MKHSLVFLCCLVTAAPLTAQKLVKTNRYALGFQFDLANTFPNVSPNEVWQPRLYAAGGFTATVVGRWNRRWFTEAGFGLTAYFLNNRGPVDNYVLDFISPHFVTTVGYNVCKRDGREGFVKLSGGFQLGFRGLFVDNFPDYRVTVTGEDLLYYFVRPEVGIRRYLRRRSLGSRYPLAYELGTFVRLNLNRLGTAVIAGVDGSTTLTPRGSMIGVFGRMNLTVGRKQLRYRPDVFTPDRIIYHPRSKQK